MRLETAIHSIRGMSFTYNAEDKHACFDLHTAFKVPSHPPPFEVEPSPKPPDVSPMKIRPVVCGPAPIAAETCAMPSHQRLGPDTRHDLHDGWKPPIQLEEEQAIAVRELDPTTHLALKHNQLTSERGILCLKSADRFERRK
jgi:hypothetical protein